MPAPAQYTVVMKFGGSSVATAEKMRNVARVVCRDANELPCVVLSAMGKVGAGRLKGLPCALESHHSLQDKMLPRPPSSDSSPQALVPLLPTDCRPQASALHPAQTTNLLLACGEAALACEAEEVATLGPLRQLRDAHLAAADRLGCSDPCKAEVRLLLHQLQQLLVGIALMKVRARATGVLTALATIYPSNVVPQPRTSCCWWAVAVKAISSFFNWQAALAILLHSVSAPSRQAVIFAHSCVPQTGADSQGARHAGVDRGAALHAHLHRLPVHDLRREGRPI